MPRHALHDASDAGDVATVRALLAALGPHALDLRSTSTYERGWTALHFASAKGHLPVVELLLDAGAAVDALTELQQTPLFLASRDGRVEVVEKLLEAGANPNRQDEFRGTPLHGASANYHVEVVQLLLDAGADATAINSSGESALHTPSCGGCAAVVQLLLEAGADPNVPDQYNQTPLHNACLRHRKEAARLLLAYGADPHVKDDEGFDPLAVCMRPAGFTYFTDDSLELIQMLIASGATWDSKSDAILVGFGSREEAPILHIAVHTWAYEHARGRPITQVPMKALECFDSSHIDLTYVVDADTLVLYVEVQNIFDKIRRLRD